MKITKKYPTEDNCQSDRNSGSRNYTTGTSSVGSYSMQEEIWKDVEGYEGYYQVSNLGGIRSLDRYVKHKNGGDMLRKGAVKNASKNNKGYLIVSLCKAGKLNVYCVHRLVASAFIENPENKKTINHKDGVKDNNRTENLEWATHVENMNHAWSSGLCRKGSQCSYSKLNEEDVLKIREYYDLQKHSQKELSVMYGVVVYTIWSIVTRKTWKHV